MRVSNSCPIRQCACLWFPLIRLGWGLCPDGMPLVVNAVAGMPVSKCLRVMIGVNVLQERHAARVLRKSDLHLQTNGRCLNSRAFRLNHGSEREILRNRKHITYLFGSACPAVMQVQRSKTGGGAQQHISGRHVHDALGSWCPVPSHFKAHSIRWY